MYWQESLSGCDAQITARQGFLVSSLRWKDDEATQQFSRPTGRRLVCKLVCVFQNV
jgi:hypothetical protein